MEEANANVPNVNTPAPEYSSARIPRAGNRPPFVRMALMALLAPVLLWLIASRSLVAYLVAAAPETALMLRPHHPSALVARAEKTIDVDKDPTQKSLEEAGGQLRDALAAFPIDARALRLFGQLSEREHDKASVARAMQAAARYSSQETIAIDWLMRNSFINRDYHKAAYYADILLRTRPEAASFALPILGRMAEDEVGKKEVEAIFASGPPWRFWFFNELGMSVTNARTPLELLLSLKDSSAPPTEGELQAYILFLFQHNLYKFAYFAWRQFLPEDQLTKTGLLFNGDFETKPSGVSFDWKLEPPDGAILDIGPRPDAPGKNALFVEFGQGRVNFKGASEMVVLPPGGYRLIGLYDGQIAGQRGMQWSVVCWGGATIGESPMILGAFPEPRQFEFAFKVPATNCDAQIVRLDFVARSSSEQLVSGLIRFHDLSIARQ